MKRKYIGRVAGAAAASLALGMMAQGAVAASPDAPQFCSAFTKISQTGTGAVAIPDATANPQPVQPAPPAPPLPPVPDTPGTAISKTITVSGASGTVRDVDAITNIVHQNNGDLDISLSHGGKTVQLVTAYLPNRSGKNGYNGTVWDDSAPKAVSEANLNDDVLQTTLAPEGALGAFVGADPNGTWTLRVQDISALATGTLNSWTLNLATSAATNATAVTNVSGPAGTIPDTHTLADGTLEKTVVVSGAKKYLTDVNLLTNITHTIDPGELQVRLTSPQGTTVLISNRRGSGSLAALSTKWDDSAGQNNLITQVGWSSQQTRPTMVPESGLGAFIGQDPNGTWKLTVADVVAADGFSLNSWSLNLTGTDNCATPPDTTPPDTTPPVDTTPVTPVVPLTPPTIATPPAPSCVKVGLVAKVTGSKKVTRGRKGVVIVKLTNASKLAAATHSTATFVIPRGFSLVKKPKGATVKKHRVTLKLGTIRAGKSKAVRLTLKAGSRAKAGRQKRTVLASAACGSRTVGKLAVTIKKA